MATLNGFRTFFRNRRGRLATVLLWGYVVLSMMLLVDARMPTLSAIRYQLLYGLIGLNVGVMIWLARGRTAPKAVGLRLVALVALAAGSGYAAREEARFRSAKERVLTADPTLVRMLGRHLVTGYDHLGEAGRLVASGAVSGLYVSRRNAAGKSAAELAREIAYLASENRRSEWPLFVMADQEGGKVSHLAPALSDQPALASAVQADGAIEARSVRAIARTHGSELNAIGININLGPVVDLRRLARRVIGYDRSNLEARAIHESPVVVTRVAKTYLGELNRHGVLGTLKHFPGLGRLDGDTHTDDLVVDRGLGELEETDFQPFRELSGGKVPNLMMLGHARVAAVDPWAPASTSREVVETLIRSDWGKTDTVLITDDLCMDPIVRSREGIGRSAVRALNAGVDLLLVSYDKEQLYVVMSALLDAYDRGELDVAKLQESELRLERMADWLRRHRRALAETH